MLFMLIQVCHLSRIQIVTLISIYYHNLYWLVIKAKSTNLNIY